MPRVNKCIDLLEAGQPVYSMPAPELTYESGLRTAGTWADLILADFEHHAFDIGGLTKFMRGLKDGGPTPSGHATPTVICTLPSNCMSAAEVLYNAWQTRHVLSTGAHGVMHTHARDVQAVRTFVATARYPFQTIGLEAGLPEGLRGAGGQRVPAAIWGMSTAEYARRADTWPLNPDGELMLGLKIEDRHCLPDAGRIAAVPGLSLAEWGPGDMAMSFGDPDGHDPPYSEQMNEARNVVKSACDAAGLKFYSSWNDPGMTDEERLRFMQDELGAWMMPATQAAADARRRETGRQLPW